MFIATANQLDPIPGPLRDRMEIIELSGYTFEEKQQIARHPPGPQAAARSTGCPPDHIAIEDEALLTLITSYTREAGVRSLERRIADVCRAVAVEVAAGKTDKQVITPDRVKEHPRARGASTPRWPSAPRCRAWPPAWPGRRWAATSSSSRPPRWPARAG